MILQTHPIGRKCGGRQPQTNRVAFDRAGRSETSHVIDGIIEFCSDFSDQPVHLCRGPAHCIEVLLFCIGISWDVPATAIHSKKERIARIHEIGESATVNQIEVGGSVYVNLESEPAFNV